MKLNRPNARVFYITVKKTDTVLSILNVTVLESAAILDDIPVPPVNVNVSESSEIFSEPLSEEISSIVDIVFVLTDVILPFESIVICGIAVVFP